MPVKNARPPRQGGAGRYLELVEEHPLRPIRSDADLDRAIAMIDRLIDIEEHSPDEADYLDVLSRLVQAYEDEHEPEPEVDGPRLLRALIEAKGVTQAKVAVDTGVAESTISDLLAGRRKFSQHVMKTLGAYFCIHPAAFLG